MEVARLLVDGTFASVVMRRAITAGLVGATVLVEYAPGIWDGLTKTVVFKGFEMKDVVTNETTVEIPWEVLQEPSRRLHVGFFGVDADEKQIIPTIWADLGPIYPGADPSGDTSTDPSLPVWAQIADNVVKLSEEVDELKQGGGTSTPGVPGADGEDGGYYTPAVTQLDEDTIQFAFTGSKPDMPAVAPVTVELPVGQGSGGNVELDTTLTQSGKAADAKAVGDKIAEITGISLVEPAYEDIPKVFFGGALQQTKDEKVVPFRYISKTDDFSGYAEIKAQGNSSMNYAKKNQTVKMFADEACDSKMKKDFKGWGKQNKHVYKANWIDITHARNVVSARLWGDVVKSRANYAELPELLRTSPNQGAVDGFPVKVYAAGVYQGRYTLNIPKDAWMANMDKNLDTNCILCGEGYLSGCFRDVSVGQWTDEVHDSMPTAIRTRWLEIIDFVMNSTDEDFKSNLGSYFYVDSLIDYYLFGLASCGLDAFGKNQLYMTYDGQRWIASMYDMDSTWGLYWNGSKFVSTSYGRDEYEDYVNSTGNLLYVRLEQLFWEELQTRWEELKNGALSIVNIINRFERFTDIAPAELVRDDYASTTGGGSFTGIPSKSNNTIQQIRDFALLRQVWTDEYVAGLTPEVRIPCTGITLSATELTFNGEGSQTLTATVTPNGCTDKIVWVSDDNSIAVVVNGTVTAKGNGSTTITAYCGDYSVSCAVSVSGMIEVVACTGITLDKSTLTFSALGSQTLVATVTPNNCTEAITWESNSPNIATVEGGIVSAVSEGSATITARCGAFSASCSITVSIPVAEKVNILEETEFKFGSLNVTTGMDDTSSRQLTTGYAAISQYQGMSMTLKVKGGIGSEEQRIAFYDADKTFLDSKYGSNAELTVNVPDNAAYARFGVLASASKIEIIVMGANTVNNIFYTDGAIVGSYYDSTNGSIKTYASYSRNSRPVEYTMYYFKNIVAGAFFDSNDSFIAGIKNDANGSERIVFVPDNAAWFGYHYFTNKESSVVIDNAEDCLVGALTNHLN